MSSRTLTPDEPLYGYPIGHSLREHPAHIALRAAARTHPRATKQISPKQGKFMAKPVKILVVRRCIEIGTFIGYYALLVALASGFSRGKHETRICTREGLENSMNTSGWLFWALLLAAFAALTAIFAKVSIEGIDSDYATLLRTIVILFAITLFVYFTGKWTNPTKVSTRSLTFLVLSGLATGASWV